MTEDQGVPRNLTVEHLLPQGWNEDGWPLPPHTASDRENVLELRRARIGLIGNLTLATKQLNTSMSNRSWKDKRAVLAQFSTLLINKEVLEQAPDNWNEDAIDQRSDQLAQAITQLWPHPFNRSVTS